MEMDELLQLVDMGELLQNCRQRMISGDSREDILAFLHEVHDSSPENRPRALEVLIILRSLYSLDIAEALRILSDDPYWGEEAGHILS